MMNLSTSRFPELSVQLIVKLSTSFFPSSIKSLFLSLFTEYSLYMKIGVELELSFAKRAIAKPTTDDYHRLRRMQ